MSLAMTANILLVGSNLLLLSALLWLYARMLRQVRTQLTAGLLAFALILWLQNAVQLYFFATMMRYYDGAVEGIVLAQNVLATLASAFLLWVTLFPAGLGGGRESARSPEP